MSDLDQLVASAEADFAAASEPAKLEDAKARYLGKDGAITQRKSFVDTTPPRPAR